MTIFKNIFTIFYYFPYLLDKKIKTSIFKGFKNREPIVRICMDHLLFI